MLGGRQLVCAALFAWASACSTVPFLSSSKNEDDGVCPSRKAAPEVLPGVKAEQRTLAYWLGRTDKPDETLLTPEEIDAYNAAFRALAKQKPADEPLTFFDLSASEDRKLLLDELRERLGYMHERLADGRYVDDDGDKLEGDDLAVFAPPDAAPELAEELRVVLEQTDLRCGPRPAAIYSASTDTPKPEVDKRFDRNSCSTIRAQEPVRILASWRGGMKLVRARYALGWIDDDTKLSPVVPDEHRDGILRGEHLRVHGKQELNGVTVEDRTLLASAGDGKALVATADGFHVSEPLAASAAEPTRRPLTKRALLTEAFSYLDTPYGWGGQQGGRDCSGFLMDVFAAFGVELPRHSALQAQAGSMRVDVSKVTAERDRLALIDAAAERGIVLLHFPGHIMLYLGRDESGRPMVMHAFAEYLEACSADDAKSSGRTETLYTVDRVQVSDLSVGKGTSRKSFLERITQIIIVGRAPGSSLQGVAERRPAAPFGDAPKKCSDSEDVTMLVSPRTPHKGAPVRVVVSSEHDLGSVILRLQDPAGKSLEPKLKALGGPPFGYWVQVDNPAVGKWTAIVGEGERVAACTRFEVADKGDELQSAGAHVWVPRRKWSRATENLYSTFIEQLYDYPFDDRTWPNLQKLLEDRERNILFDHLGQNDEAELGLEPDCADLSYFLRAYFSWKLRLPFAFRHCSRGKNGEAPYCDHDLHDNLVRVGGKSEVWSFSNFVRGNVGNGVHSGTGRTGPAQDDTDYYPIPLSRDAIRPGKVFADPYGHSFVIVDWIPQVASGNGVLVGADGQPDGTLGRRRFWRGTFLFTPDTHEAGAGFKAFRPLVYAGETIHSIDNDGIAKVNGMAPFSLEQYQGSKDDFYDRVEALINPRPLDPLQALDVLIDALHEQVKARVVSVDNGEKYKKENPGVIEMPEGHSIFETEGAWEDYSTPSRDMRLLIAMDTVMGFAEVVERRPERFGLEKGDSLKSAVAELRRHLESELGKRRFSYVKSDGATVELTVKQALARAKDLEMAYNPNDCVEIRWAAPEGSDERKTCRQHAPGDQLTHMRNYRSWFATRTRPAR